MDRKAFFKNGLFSALSIAAAKVIRIQEVPINNLDNQLNKFYKNNRSEFNRCSFSHGGIKEIYFVSPDELESWEKLHTKSK